MKIFDTLSQELKEFFPSEPNKVKMYVCGPTVYDYPHLGHARCYITWDVVSKYLRFKGYDLTYVRNITDVDDKIINKARESNLSAQQIAEIYYEEFVKAMKELNVADPDIEPKATENIQEMIDIIQILIDKGYAYAVDGDVFFRINKYNKYGRLSKQNVDDLKSGARIEASEKKKDPLDFTLWKPVKSEDETGWDSPWGKGRPGWHIECSAMAKKYLGDTIDIHAGGQDLTFPHHENEKAQSECALGIEFVKYWLHNGFVIINQEKMSKSLDNFVTIKDVLEKYDSNTIRFFILTNHYRMPIEFGEDGLKTAKAGFRRLNNAFLDTKRVVPDKEIEDAIILINALLQEIVQAGSLPFSNLDQSKNLENQVPTEAIEFIISRIKAFLNAMDDDFNTSVALSVLFDIAGGINKSRNEHKLKESAFYTAILIKLGEILGFDFKKEEVFIGDLTPKLMDLIISIRNTARNQKSWELSDKIRDDLAKLNIVIKDHKDGTSWSVGE